MAKTKTTVIAPTNDGERLFDFEDAIGRIVDGCLVIQSQNITLLYAPGQWLRAWTEKVDATA